MLAPARVTLLGVFLAGSLAACDAPIVGEWRSDKKLGNGERNVLTVASDFTGTAEIFATPASNHALWNKFEFDVEWEDDVEEYDLTMDCDKGPCDKDDFVMECIVIDEENGEVEKLECKAGGEWAKYVFDFERHVE